MTKAKAKKTETKDNGVRRGKDGRKLGRRVNDAMVVKGIKKYVAESENPTFWSCVKWFRAKGVGIGHARIERIWNETV